MACWRRASSFQFVLIHPSCVFSSCTRLEAHTHTHHRTPHTTHARTQHAYAHDNSQPECSWRRCSAQWRRKQLCGRGRLAYGSRGGRERLDEPGEREELQHALLRRAPQPHRVAPHFGRRMERVAHLAQLLLAAAATAALGRRHRRRPPWWGIGHVIRVGFGVGRAQVEVEGEERVGVVDGRQRGGGGRRGR